MISFWLLCWKLLRATAGFRRTIPELTDGNHDNNHPSTSSAAAHSDNPVTMEMNSSPSITDPVRDDSHGSNDHNPEGLCCSESHEDEEEAAKGDERDYPFLKTEEETGGEEQGEGDGWRGAINEEDDGVWEEKGAKETEEPDGGKVKEENGHEEEPWTENLGKDEGENENADQSVTGMLGEKKQDSSANLLNNENPKYLLFQAPAVTSDPSEAVLQESWRWEDSGKTEDFSNDHLSDCLQAELAIVYPESDAEEDQWAALSPCDNTSHIEESEITTDSTYGAENKEETKVVGEEVKGECREDDEEQMKSERDFILQSPSVSSITSSTDSDRRIPVDFCVQQETLSENVSTEHLDFLLARRQWKKMEEEVKGQPIPKPGLRAQGSFQGTHSALYPPTRSPRLKHREIQPQVSREPPPSSTLSPSSEDTGLEDFLYRSPVEQPESAVEKEIRLTLEREERHRRERGMIAQGLKKPQLQTGRSPPRPPACRTPTLSISPSPSCSSSLSQSTYHELTANNVIILEPSSSSFASKNRLFSSGPDLFSWHTNLDATSPANVVVVETSNLIIRSASEFCLSSAPASVETQESTFTSNPFFKLRSISNQSLVEQEIRTVRQREAEWKKQREEMWRKQKREEEWRRGKEKYDTVLVCPALNENSSFSEVPHRCVSSPSSPSRPRKIQRSSLSCDHKFPPSLSSVPQRQNAMAQRWEATLLANQKEE